MATTYDLVEMAREILFMFLRHLAPVVADVTLGVRAPPSLVLECSQKQRHGGKPYTVRRAGHEMSLCTCVILGGRDSALDLSDSVPYNPPHVHHRTAAACKTQTTHPIDKESQSSCG